MLKLLVNLKVTLLFLLRKLRLFFTVFGKRRYLKYGKNLHLGANVRLWAPNKIDIGDNVYIGKDVHIECNTIIGSNSLIANRVAFVGRNDHDFSTIGIPVRFSTWVGLNTDKSSNDFVDIGEDTWIGFGTVILTGVRVGKGCIIGAGSVVTKDIPDYCIAAGVPAKKIKMRFNHEQIKAHEYKIRHGLFQYSLKGLRYSVIKPFNVNKNLL